MTVDQAIARLEQMRGFGHGNKPLVVTDCRSGVSDSVGSFCIRESSERGDGWERDQPEGTVYVAVNIG